MIFAWRFALSLIFAARRRAALVAAVLALQAAALGGGLAAQDSLEHTRRAWSNELALADLEVQTVAVAPDELPSMEALARVPGVAAVHRRFLALRTLERRGVSLPVLVHYEEPGDTPPINRVAIVEGAGLRVGHPEEALVDRAFADEHRVRIGDELVLDAHRVPERLRVVGVALSAEHLVATANPEMLVPDRGSLGVVYASRELVDRRFEEPLYDDLVFRFEDPARAPSATRAILDLLRGVEVLRVTPREASFAERYLDVMLAGARVMTPVTGAIFALMAAVVACVAVLRAASERRREIGCLVAQGYTLGQVSVIFVAVGLLPAVVGGLLGALGAVPFAVAAASTSARLAGLPEPRMIFPLADLATGAATAVLVGAVAAALPARAIAHLTAVEALRGAGEFAFLGLPARLERLVFGGLRLRYATRNLLRRPKLTAAAVTLVALAVSLPAALLTSLASWQTWARDDAARARWDAVVTFRARVTDDEARAVAGPTLEREGYVQGYAVLERSGAPDEQLRVRGIDVASSLSPPSLVAGRGPSSDDAAEIVLNGGFQVGRPEPHVGDEVVLAHGGARHELTVVGLVADAGLSTGYVPRGLAARLFGERLSGMYVRTSSADGARVKEELERLRLAEMVSSVQTRDEVASATARYLAGFHGVLEPFVGLSVLLALAFLTGVVGFLVAERDAEYATLGALGHDGRALGGLVLTEVTMLGAAGLLMALPAWVVTALALRAAMAVAWFEVPLDLRAVDFGGVAILAALAVVLSALPAARALAAMDYAAALRPRSIG